MDTYIDRVDGRVVYLGVKRLARLGGFEPEDPAYWKYTWPYVEDRIEKKLRECAELEVSRGFPEHLRLSRYLDYEGLVLHGDFAPLSFTFHLAGIHGGIIFHGQHDRGGDGGPPTFSVNLSPVDGWAMHT